LSDGSVHETNFILNAIGREANIKNLNLEIIGIKLGKQGFVKVDRNQQTNVPNVYALGDVTNRPQLTPVAIRTGRTWAENIFNNRPEL